MGRDFYTKQDQYPEIDETFKVASITPSIMVTTTTAS